MVELIVLSSRSGRAVQHF